METTLNPASRPGDLWCLGRHRVICGDATDGPTVARVLAGACPNLMVTDPPYGVCYDPAWRDRVLGKASRAQGTIRNDDQSDWRAAWMLFPGDIAYVWHSTLHTSSVEASLYAAGFVPRSQIIWDKGRLIISRGHYHWRHEPCWYAVRRGRTANWQGDRRQMTVWPVPHRRSASGHPTEKPIEIMRRPILNHTREGDLVYDPFLGSGSTLIAAEETGRVCLGVELAPEHCDRIVRRWADISGGTPLLMAA